MPAPKIKRADRIANAWAFREFDEEKKQLAELKKFYKEILRCCYDPTHPKYWENGGRGIVCQWETFADFYEDWKQEHFD